MIKFHVKENIEASNKSWNDFKKLNEKLRHKEILVGIPESTSPRKNGEMNNATLLFIHTNGSPLNHLPPRPLIEPALSADDNADKIVGDLKRVAEIALSGNIEGAARMMKLTGMDAVKMIRAWFDDPRNGWAPNQPSTVRAKINKKKMSKAKKQSLLDRYEGGEEGIDTPLVDTGELKKSITYVVREKI